MTGSVNLETAKVNVTTVASAIVSTVAACFWIYWYIGGMVEEALVDAKIFAIELDIERDEGVIDMYTFQIDNNLAAPTAESRRDTLRENVRNRRMQISALEASK